MMKKFLFAALTLIVTAAFLFSACSDSDTDNTPAIPSVTLTAGTVTPTSLEFTATLENADKCAYLCTEKSAAIPQMAEILASGKSVTESGIVPVDKLKPSTEYLISAVATRGGAKLVGEVHTLLMTTGTPTPVITLTAGTPSHDQVTFDVTLSDTERAAYVCLEKTKETAIPSAEKILADGTTITENGKQIVSSLKYGTTYVIAVAAVNKDVYSEVESIEMTTVTPAIPIITLVEGTPSSNELAFYLAMSDVEHAAYLCMKKSETTSTPSAEKILSEGTAITDTGKVTVSGLEASTSYIIAVAASNKGVYSEVKTLEMTTEDEKQGPVTFTQQAAGAYYGDTYNTGYTEYYFVVADGATNETDGIYTTVGAGRAMSFDLYQLAPYNFDLIKIPTRTYRYNTNHSMSTFDPAKTFCMVNDGKGGISKIEFQAGTVDVKLTGTTYTITAELTTTAGEAFSATYTGTLNIENKVETNNLPLLEKDVTGMSFIRALAKYYNNTDAEDNCIVNLYDVEPKISGTSDYLNQAGHMVSLDLSTAVSSDMALQEGTYTVSADQTKGTFAPGYQTTFMDMVMAVGTYCEERNDNALSFYGFITGGTITITKSGENYRFDIDCTTDKGYKMSGSYEGKVEMMDMR